MLVSIIAIFVLCSFVVALDAEIVVGAKNAENVDDPVTALNPLLLEPLLELQV